MDFLDDTGSQAWLKLNPNILRREQDSAFHLPGIERQDRLIRQRSISPNADNERAVVCLPAKSPKFAPGYGIRDCRRQQIQKLLRRSSTSTRKKSSSNWSMRISNWLLSGVRSTRLHAKDHFHPAQAGRGYSPCYLPLPGSGRFQFVNRLGPRIISTINQRSGTGQCPTSRRDQPG
jgi:hypothetical protein